LAIAEKSSGREQPAECASSDFCEDERFFERESNKQKARRVAAGLTKVLLN
jgi:hypothetical protein